MQQFITEAGALYPIAVAEASNNTTAKGEDRYVLHKGVMWRHPRLVRSQWQPTFHDLSPWKSAFGAMAIPCKRAGFKCSL
jgi:hypothetical protein